MFVFLRTIAAQKPSLVHQWSIQVNNFKWTKEANEKQKQEQTASKAKPSPTQYDSSMMFNH